MGSFLQLSGRPEIELQPKVDPTVGGERAVSARVSLWCARRAPFRKKGAVQVPGLGLKMRALAGAATKIQADSRDLFRVAAMSDATSTVLVIDDDPDLRASVGRLLRSPGITVQLFASLSPREREIVIQVARGRLSKQIAHDIGIAEATVKVHRSRAMQKMQAGSLPELGRMADKLKLVPDTPQRS